MREMLTTLLKGLALPVLLATGLALAGEEPRSGSDAAPGNDVKADAKQGSGEAGAIRT